MPLVYAHEMLSQCDVYFLNGGHFSKFLYLVLLSTWLNLDPSYLAQLRTYTGATHREEIIHLSIIFLKLWIFKKIHILHFLTHWQTCQRHLVYKWHTTHRHMHTHRHRYHFWLIGLKNQWCYLIKKQVCLWTHFRQSKCSTTHLPLLPATTTHPNCPLPPPNLP